MTKPSRSRRLISLLVALVVSTVVACQPVLAVDEQFYAGNDIFFYTPGDPCAVAPDTTTLSATSTAASTGGSVEKILKYFTEKGLTLAAAAGFVGNMTGESGVNPRAIQPSKEAPVNYTPVDGQGFGLIQWTFSSRQKPLVALASSTKRNTTDIDLQLDYIWKELNSSYKSTLKALTKTYTTPLTPAQATIIIHGRTKPFANNPDFQIAPTLGYEASASTDYAAFKTRRIDPAKSAYDKYRSLIADGRGLSSDVSTLSASLECGGDGAATISNGMAFPVIATKQVIKSSGWCWAKTTNCHHDYNAADIMAPEGSTIVAATSGTVNYTKVNGSGAAGGNRDSLSIKSANGNIWYYTHAKPNSMVVKEGQTVSAGDKLMVVGNKAAADNTGTHLHIDELPKSIGHRVSCASAQCTSYPFIDIQPILKNLFDQMPDSTTQGAL